MHSATFRRQERFVAGSLLGHTSTCTINSIAEMILKTLVQMQRTLICLMLGFLGKILVCRDKGVLPQSGIEAGRYMCSFPLSVSDPSLQAQTLKQWKEALCSIVIVIVISEYRR
jgi:hypothetical protein